VRKPPKEASHIEIRFGRSLETTDTVRRSQMASGAVGLDEKRIHHVHDGADTDSARQRGLVARDEYKGRHYLLDP
jgi:hypothetical protein